MPTRQTSSSGKPKSPRIQVVLPEELCERLAALAELEARTVSNMARVLIQQGVERLESLHGLESEDMSATAPAELPRSVRPAPKDLSRRDRSRRAPSVSSPSRGASSEAPPFSADAFRAELERQGQEPSPRAQRPRRLRIWRPS